ncbi:MAG: TIM barrel protein, partial [Rhodothermales bacterium]|nr:TIM barrel protein [Rhodothermales bacterium]
GAAVAAPLRAARAAVAALPARQRSGAAFRQSVCRWCYGEMTVAELADVAIEVGLASVELLDPEEWPVVQARGLTCAMPNAPRPPAAVAGGLGFIEWGWNRLDHHDWLVPAYEERLEAVAAAGLPNLICFSGNRGGLSDAEGLAHCVRGLRQITPAAERLGVTLCMELLNSKVDHPDYQADRTRWGVALVEAVGSERFRLLYDVYHMQIMEGDVIRTIRDHAGAIAHYHTAGVPGRHEIDDTQELNYPAICRAIAETGFTGFLAQEFIPTREPIAALRDAVTRCTV